MITFQLWNFTGTGFVIPCPSGFRYSNQAGGIGCTHPELEGAFVMLDRTSDLIPHVGCFRDEIEESEADQLDQYFALGKGCGYSITVDRSRLGDSTEAWVWVNCAPVDDGFTGFHPLAGYSGPAVFTWENCD